MSHLLGAIVFLGLGIKSLVNFHRDFIPIFSTIIITFAVIFALSMSGVYHLLTPATTGRAVLQRLDHAAIFFLIAGSFTPIHLLLFRGPMRWAFLSLIWVIAITSITLKAIYFRSFSEWFGLILYIGLGWMGAITGYLLYRRFGLSFIKKLLYGALAYTIGAVLDFVGFPILVPRVLGPHEIFHIAVLTGIGLHWSFFADCLKQCYPPQKDTVE